MYICVNYSGKDKKNAYVKLMEAYWTDDGKKKAHVIKNFGRLDDLLAQNPNALEELRAQYKEKMDAPKVALKEERLTYVMNLLQKSSEPHAMLDYAPLPSLQYGHYALRSIWENDLGLTWKLNYLQKTSGSRCQFNFNAVALFMASLKVIDPRSVLFSYNSKDDFLGDPLKDITLDNCYDTLSFLKENKDKIFRWCNKKLDEKFGTSRASLVFYDVTNAYFETPLTDEEKDYEQCDFAERVQAAADRMRLEGLLKDDCFDSDGMVIADKLPPEFWEVDANNRLRYLRMRGPSKEHRTDLPLVSIALVIDQNGFPMDFEVFSGNASEFKTMKQAIQQLKNKYKIGNAIVVADRGLNSASNLKMLNDLDLGFLVAQKVTNFSASLTEKMLDMSLYTPIDPDNPERGMYQIVNNWKKKNKKGDSVNCMLVLTYNDKRKRRDDKIIDAMISIVNNKKDAGDKIGPQKRGWAAFALTDQTEKEEYQILGVDEEVVAKKRRFSGFAAVVYEDAPSLSKALNPDSESEETTKAGSQKRFFEGKEIVKQYSRLTRIEDCFRVLKTNLGLRPMYVYTSDHIRGHITVCLLALLLLRLLQHRLRTQGVRLSVHEICRSLVDATITPFGDAKKDMMFLLTGRLPSARKNRSYTSSRELANSIKEGSISNTHMPDIMRACDLSPIAQVTNLSELAKALHTRFPSPAEAISEVRMVAYS